MSKRPGSYFRNKKKQKEAEAQELAAQWEKSKSKWFNVKNEIDSLEEDGASENQKINESIEIEIDSGCSIKYQRIEFSKNTCRDCRVG
jgi:hypothetical protein